jgi:hypothetical protein
LGLGHELFESGVEFIHSTIELVLDEVHFGMHGSHVIIHFGMNGSNVIIQFLIGFFLVSGSH